MKGRGTGKRGVNVARRVTGAFGCILMNQETEFPQSRSSVSFFHSFFHGFSVSCEKGLDGTAKFVYD